MVDFLESGVLKFKRVAFCWYRSLYPGKLTSVPAVRRWLTYGNRSRRMLGRATGMSEQGKLERLAECNVIVQIEHLPTHPSVKRRFGQGKLGLHGWMYHLHDGELLQLDPPTG